jgi:DNA-binding GntR family transcriptional regulator
VTGLIDDHRLIVDALEAADVTGGRQHIKAHARRVLEHAPSLRRQYPG